MSATGFAPGDGLPALRKPPVTKTQLVMYSGASGDFNPIHTVDEYAKEAGLGGVIAHGMLTMAFVGQMLTDVVGEAGQLVEFGVRFVDMVRPGDEITCTGTVTRVEDEGVMQRVFAEVLASTQADKVVVKGDAELLVPKAG